jgi:2-alkyl-3-oxoalkanoate reductase
MLAVTGITSGVGMRLAEMALERGHALRALVRDPQRADARSLEAQGVVLVAGDLESPAALAKLAEGADAVLHLAAHVGDKGDRATFERINVGGTRLALEGAASAGVKRFVQLSSTAVYGRPDRGRVDESWPVLDSGQAYDDTKLAAEKLAFATGPELGLEVVAIRPPIIYGPYDRNFMPRAVDALFGRRFLLIDGGRAPLNMVWVDHLVDALLLAAERPGLAGEAFNVMDEVDRWPPSVRDVAETIARAVGAPTPSLSLPYPFALGVGHLVEKAVALLRPAATPPLSPFVVRILTRHVIYDASKAKRLLGWQPKVSTIEGVRREAEAYAKKLCA